MSLPVWLPCKSPEEAVSFYRDKKLSASGNSVLLQEVERQLCLNDLFYLLVYVLGRKDMLHPWLFARCREVQQEPNGYLDLWSREHRKSSIITIGCTIQDILNDPEITIGIFSHTRSIAKSFLRPIKRTFENNAKLKSLFPDVLYADPSRESPQWSDEGIIVKRRQNPPEATVEACGLIDGMPTGRHFRLRVYDDVVTRESVTTAEQVEKTIEAFSLSDNLGMEGGWCRIIGTRYSLRDAYANILQKGIAKPRLYPATHNGKLDGKPVFFSEDEWARRKNTQTKSTIAAQLLQNPLADTDAVFSALWLKAYEVRPRTLNVAILCDPSLGRNTDSDNTAIIVLGMSANGGVFLLDGYCHRMQLSQRWIALKTLYRRWSDEPGVMHVDVGYERYGAQSDMEYFSEQMKKKGEEDFPIQEINWVQGGVAAQAKTVRVSRLEPAFRNGRFFLPLAVLHNKEACTWSVDTDPESKLYQTVQYRPVEGLTKAQRVAIDGGSQDLVCKAIKRYDEEGKMYDLTEKFITEYLYFPFGEYKDLLDAASRHFDVELQPPVITPPGAGEPRQYWDS